ncbi:MAG: RHS repeat-associated core domain-containing protein [Anaerolineae bacterium]
MAKARGVTAVVNHLIYDAFGRVTAESNPAVDSLFLFTARPFDPDTVLQNNLNRWYDFRVGRWLSEDPIGFAGGDGNLYRYVGNSPNTGLDPIGYALRTRKTIVCITLVSAASAAAGATSALCAFAFVPGEGAGGIDAAEVAGCIAAAASTIATIAGAVDVCLDANCHNAVAYLHYLKQEMEYLRANAQAIAATIGAEL